MVKKDVKDKICNILVKHSDEWGWEGHASLVNDLLDVKDHITAEQIVDLLEAVIDTQGGNEAFKVAVASMRAMLSEDETEDTAVDNQDMATTTTSKTTNSTVN